MRREVGWFGGGAGSILSSMSVITHKAGKVCKSATVCLMGLRSVQLRKRKTWE